MRRVLAIVFLLVPIFVFSGGNSEDTADSQGNGGMGGTSFTIHESPPSTSEEFWNEGDFSAFEGTTIRYVARDVSEYEQELIEEFEGLTGIEVNNETYSYSDLKNKVQLELMAGGTSIDVFDMQAFLEGIKYSSAGFIEPLGTYVDNPQLTDPEWNIEDFLRGSIELGTFEGELKAIPDFVGGNLFYYRKDLLREAGIEVPQTFEEFMNAASELATDADGDGEWDTFGVAMRAEFNLAHAASWLFTYGGGFFDEEGNIILNSDESVQAISDYVDTLNSYGPEGLIPYEDTLAAFTSGRAALFIGPAGRMQSFIDPEASDIADSLGVGVVPEGPNGERAPLTGGYHIAISSGSTNTPAAWLFLQYITRPAVAEEKLRDGIPSARISSWEQANELLPEDLHEWAAAFRESAEYSSGPTHVPAAIRGLEMRSAIEDQIVAAIEGERSVQEALDQAAAAMQELIVPGEFN